MTLPGGHHVTLLAKDNTGYSNLCRLITGAQLKGRKGGPILDLESLAKHSNGLLCLSGCRKGEIASSVLSGQVGEACEAAKRYMDIFGKDKFYIELQNNLYPEDRRLCRALVGLAEKLELGYVATSNT